jgi:hypothetical protein
MALISRACEKASSSRENTGVVDTTLVHRQKGGIDDGIRIDCF